MAAHTIINPPTLRNPQPAAYAHVAIVPASSQLIYTAGQIGTDKNGFTPSTIEAQMKIMFHNIKTCLGAAGASICDIVSMNIYVVDYDPNNPAVLDRLREFFTDNNCHHFVPATLVPVHKLALPDLLVEMNVVAEVPSSPESASPPEALTSLDAEVIVVGAGLSGLQAAYDLQAEGISTIILEARDRVGGKTFSKPSLSGPGVTESGAAWINDTTHPKMYALTRKFGIKTVVQQTEGHEILVEKSGDIHRIAHIGGQAAIVDRDDITYSRLCEIIDTEAFKVDIFKIKPGSPEFKDSSLDQWLTDRGLTEGVAYDYFKSFVRAILGVEVEEISALYFLDYVKSGLGMASLQLDDEGGAQYLRIQSGTQSVSFGLAGSLKPGTVHLNAAVKSIQQLGKNHCLVTTAAGSIFRCRRVILSVPTPLYRSITFEPALPADKNEYANSTRLGDYAKLALVYKEPWWRKLGLSGSFCDLGGPVSFSRDTSCDAQKQFSLTFFIPGKYCRQWSIQSKEERKRIILENIDSMINSDEGRKQLYNYVEAREAIWMPEPWSRGAPCPVPGPGDWERLGPSLRVPFGNVHFVGTETAFLWKGYMEGAVASGERGAREVSEALQSKARM